MRDCEDCGAGYGEPFFFLWLDDNTWEQIGMKKDSCLCPHCTLDRLMKAGYTFMYGACPINGSRKPKRCFTIEQADLEIHIIDKRPNLCKT